MATVHVPILVRPILETLLEAFREHSAQSTGCLTEPVWLVDCTLGGGGHTAAFLDAFEKDPLLRETKVVAFDQDKTAIESARMRFATEITAGRLEIIQSRFSDAEPFLRNRLVLGLMADLGFSSDQLEDPSRGLSFLADGPLDMRLDPSQGTSCRDYLADISETELERVLREYGEERFSRRIAARVIEYRNREGAPATTQVLRTLVVQAIPPAMRHGRIHAATRTFQALRIAVNRELEELDCLLDHVILSLRPRGRVAILSFHSLEDRRVKHAFRSTDFRALTKKPIIADDEEIAKNPRARSAKLRVAERISAKGA